MTFGTLRAERGYTLVEMLTVMVIMGLVMTGLTTVFISASKSETDMNQRFQAQLTAKVGLDKMRREVRCADSVTTATPSASSASAITLDLPTYCKTGSGAVTWCTRSVATNRYGLYRAVGSSCTGGVLWADYMVPSGSAPTCGTPTALCVFAYTAGSTTSLALLHVDLPVNLKPSRTVDLYELADDIVLRNSSRS
ncbi:MAG: type II secretion system protein [Actinobacteria bacterium]|nr:MAG: type II secretion system protein [Actinomycetota bacterium]